MSRFEDFPTGSFTKFPSLKRISLEAKMLIGPSYKVDDLYEDIRKKEEKKDTGPANVHSSTDAGFRGHCQFDALLPDSDVESKLAAPYRLSQHPCTVLHLRGQDVYAVSIWILRALVGTREEF